MTLYLPMEENPLTEDFWRAEKQELSSRFQELAMLILLAGANRGAEVMPSGLSVLVDWDVFNRAALSWLRAYFSLDATAAVNVPAGAFAWVQTLTESTRRQVVTEIEAWVQAGEPLPVLEARLKPIFGNDRARRVAVTEATRIYSHGSIEAWKSSGVVGAKRWETARDELVCPICRELYGSIVEIDGTWNFTPEMLAANTELAKALRQPTSHYGPPAHINCRCWPMPVVLEAYEPGELDGKWFNGR